MNFINHFDIQAFHFLRPIYLWIFIPIVVIAVLIIASNTEKSQWKKVIAPHLQKYMFTKAKSRSWLWPLCSMILGLTFMTLATAGPTWIKKEIPGMTADAVLIIGLDASHSMLATDIQPNRIERAKLKIADLLNSKPDIPIGLFVFAGTAHPVVPVCTDYKLIMHQLNSLSPGIMPVQGTNFEFAMEQTKSMMQKIEAPSTLLLFTDNIGVNDANVLESFVDNSIHYIEIINTASRQGALIPGYRKGSKMKDKSGNEVLSKPDVNVLNKLNSNPKIKVNQLTLDKSDVEIIAEKVSSKLKYKLDDTASDEEWEDMGIYLIWPTFILILFWFRRGWVVQFSIVLSFMLSYGCKPDSKHADLWFSKDYQAQYFYQKDSFKLAADNFESLNHKGVAYYKSGNFEAAANVFALDSSANGYYNKALALAELGLYSESIEAMQQSIALNPESERTKNSIAAIFEQKKMNDSLQRMTGFKKEIPKPENDLGELRTRKAASEDEELSSDTEVDELPEEGTRVADEVETNITQAEELERPPENMDMDAKQVDAKNIMLRKISADPGEFLRRRFKLQKEKYYPEIKRSNEPW